MNKENLNYFWKFMYYTWVLKFYSYQHKKLNVKINTAWFRILHPIWFIFLIFFIIVWIFMNWLLETFEDWKKIFILF